MRKGLTHNKTNIKDDHCFNSDSETDIDLLKLQLLQCSESKKFVQPKKKNFSNSKSSLIKKNNNLYPIIYERPSSATNIRTTLGNNLTHSGPSTDRSYRQKSIYTTHWARGFRNAERSLSPPIRRLHPRYKKLTKSSSLECICQKTTPQKISKQKPKLEKYLRDKINESSSKHKIFPFQPTSSGNLKVIPSQVAYETRKFSVLIADTNQTKVNNSDCANSGFIPSEAQALRNMNRNKFSLMMMGGDVNSDGDCSSDAEIPESVGDVLKPEIRLERLGITNTEPFSWEKVTMHGKTNLYEELNRRITNYILADCIVYIGNEEFSCHLIVLQSYSKFFENVNDKKVDLRKQTAVSPKAFATIYGWMITHEDDSYKLLTRDNCLELFSASKYLGIKELEEQCWMFIDSEEVFNEETAFLLFMEAKHRCQVDVMQLMIPRIRKFFLTLVSSQDYLDLSADEVCAFLSSNYIYINCEMEVLMSAVRWLRCDWKDRQKHLVDLMKCVRFGWIEPWQLIDVKRNPENPEFIAIMRNPEVLRMVDDGLAFVIIKYWYGHKNDDFQHWLDLLGLEEPAHRNLSGEEKNYITFRQFLEYLDVYRNEAIMEKTLPKVAKKNQSRSRTSRANTTGAESVKKHPVPTMDEMLASRKINFAQIQENDTNSINCSVDSENPNIWNLNTNMIKSKRRKDDSQKYKTVEKTRKRDDKTSQHQRDMVAMNEISTTKLGKSSKNLLTEGSLFVANRETILVFGGIDPHSQYGIGRNTGKDVYQYIPESNIWKYVTELPEPRHHHSVTFLRGRVYLVGGADPREDDMRDKSHAVNTTWSFDPVSRLWYSQCSMNTPRKNLGLVVNRQKIYAIGGQDLLGRVLSSVERYDPDTETWEEITSLKTPRMGVACTKYRDYIWIAGGMTGLKNNPVSSDVECYDTRSNEWTQLTSLRFPRCFSRLFVMNDTLYLIGGAGRANNKDKGGLTSSVEAIDVWSNTDKQWRLFTEMAIPRHGHAVAYIGTQILIIGGVTTVYMRALSNVECYCVERSTWVRGIAGLPTTLSGHGAVTLPPASLM